MRTKSPVYKALGTVLGNLFLGIRARSLAPGIVEILSLAIFVDTVDTVRFEHGFERCTQSLALGLSGFLFLTLFISGGSIGSALVACLGLTRSCVLVGLCTFVQLSCGQCGCKKSACAPRTVVPKGGHRSERCRPHRSTCKCSPQRRQHFAASANTVRLVTRSRVFISPLEHENGSLCCDHGHNGFSIIPLFINHLQKNGPEGPL